MKILVAYFSKTGNTKAVAERIAALLGAELDVIVDRDGDSEKKIMKKEPAAISFGKNPADYDQVVLGSPVWGFSVPPVMRAYLAQNRFKAVAAFCTYGLWPGFFFWQMKKGAKAALIRLKVHMKKVQDCEGAVQAFADAIRKQSLANSAKN